MTGLRTKRQKCQPHEHVDREMRTRATKTGEKIKRVQCLKCGDVFPCKKPCEHVDCLSALGRPTPDWITEGSVAPESTTQRERPRRERP